eukprot:TRINITY_DN1864_c0_g1_i2.p1 TRINITY_DN1864_c0_g1~~TRINITY_DN1864_c0_g1_i2.p1  ORF type:complete len:652 (-),score=92.34 TRINITY_DN1864_c0_g1_i2:424-2379(-)
MIMIAEELFRTIESKNLPKLQVLLTSTNRSLLNSEDAQGNTPLHIAAKLGSIGILLHLLQFGPNLNKQNKQGNTPIHLAAFENQEGSILWLIKKGADIETIKNNDGQTAADIIPEKIRTVVQVYQQSLLKLPNMYGEQPTRTRVRALPELRDQLDLAIKKGDIETVKDLIEQKQQDFEMRNIEGKNPLHLACEFGHGHVVEYLLGKGANPNREEEYKSTPILIASCKNYSRIVQQLIQAGAVVEARSLFGHSSLILASQLGYIDTVKVLIENGNADPNQRDRDGNTPYHLSIKYGHAAVAKYLHQHEADDSALNKKGQTPMDLASIKLRDLLLGNTPIDGTDVETDSMRTNNVSLSEAFSSSPFFSKETVEMIYKMEIPYEQLEIKEVLGDGSFGVVYKAKYKTKEVAVKKISGELWKTPSSAKLFANEISVLYQAQHSNIVKLIGANLQTPNFGIICEWMKKGSLSHLIHKKKLKLNKTLVVKVSKGIADGMRHLHSMGIIHRDLRTANILIDRQWNAKIADFGLVCKIEDGADAENSGIGPLRWMAPELYQKQKFSEKVDVFSFSLLVWEMISCEPPMSDLSPLETAALWAEGTRPPIKEDTGRKFSDEVVQMICTCWRSEAEERPSFQDIFSTLLEVEKTLGDSTLPV